MSKLERKFGKYAVKNLTLILLVLYATGYVASLINGASGILYYLTLDPYQIIHHGQIWRLVTWLFIPQSSSFNILIIITFMFYYSIGKSLENVWGDWLYNVYVFSGMLFTIIAAFLIYLYLAFFPGQYAEMVQVYGLENLCSVIAFGYVTSYYMCMSVFFAFAATFPDNQVLLMFIIPIKVKWLGIAYGIYYLYEFIMSDVFARLIMGASFLNFVLFFLIERKRMGQDPLSRVKQTKRRKQYDKRMRVDSGGFSVHKCAICGRTSTEYPDLSFRFCSKCNGSYEYCSDHLFTHKHVE